MHIVFGKYDTVRTNIKKGQRDTYVCVCFWYRCDMRRIVSRRVHKYTVNNEYKCCIYVIIVIILQSQSMMSYDVHLILQTQILLQILPLKTISFRTDTSNQHWPQNPVNSVKFLYIPQLPRDPRHSQPCTAPAWMTGYISAIKHKISAGWHNSKSQSL